MLDSINNIKITDYNYNLQNQRIAKYPLEHRDESKLLVYSKGKIFDDVFYNIDSYLSDDYLMVFNNTKVIHARLHFKKHTGASIEVFLLEPHCPHDYESIFQVKTQCEWVCMIGNLKKWKNEILEAEVEINEQKVIINADKYYDTKGQCIVKLAWNNNDFTFAEILNAFGQLPIPPYLNRETEASDIKTYQTVYSKIKGSVAAPTAGLHFTDRILNKIDSKHIQREELTLHVGAGTFKPVKTEYIAYHAMHQEYISVPRHAIQSLIEKSGNAIAVGTTSVRTLESLYYIGKQIINNPEINQNDIHVDQWEPYLQSDSSNEYDDVTQKLCKSDLITPIEALRAIDSYMERNNIENLHGSTQIMIVPGYKYKFVKMLITNFHQPQSTLLLLVSAFVGDAWHNIYEHALDHNYRFLSYGDSSLLIP